ncbi:MULTISPECIES: hypothetical protein [unclassified Roseitalea]|uniref:hypothetical protein n=1 Tax=unclassified Roseitalea TaxID=2639107 RepID=UPI00273E581A|nr:MULTISPECIES: hypothetical protein [unclassified Roseitalea]
MAGSEHETAPAGGGALSRDLVVSMAETLSVQAGRLLDQARGADTYQKPVVEAIVTVGRAADALAGLVKRLAPEAGEASGADDPAEISAFFAAVEERIDERSEERARAMVSAAGERVCPACGAALRPAGPA